MRKSLILRSAILLTTIFVGLLALDPGQVTYATLADGLGYSASVVNSPPSADAGKSQTVRRDDTVQLDGSQSSDPEGSTLTFRWSFVLRPAHSSARFDDPRSARPTFLADRVGIYLVSLTVNDGQLNSFPSLVIILALPAQNRAPQAVDDFAFTTENNPVDINLLANDSDPDGDSITITRISQAAHGTINNNGSSITYSPNTGFVGQDNFQYTISDGRLSASAGVLIKIGTVNHAPTANAGPDQTLAVNSLVQLDGSGSSDPDGNALSFQWLLQDKPAGSSATLNNPTAVNPTFTIDQAGTYTIQLVVSDGQLSSIADTVQVSTSNSPPVANAGADQTVAVTSTVHLDGSGSADIDGNPLTFHWALRSVPGGSSATLSNPNLVNPTFILDTVGDYVIELVVNDGTVDSAPDTVVISTQNSAPVANAGPDQSTLVGNTVQLNGSGSSDVDGNTLTFLWSFVSKPAGSVATLDNSTSVNPTFVVDVPGSYAVQLIVNDGSVDSAADTVTVATENRPPVANAGPDQSVAVGSTVQLDGSASTDPDNNSLTFTWSFVSVPNGSLAALSNANVSNPTFVADVAGTYVAQLVVNDGTASSAPDTVVITTENSVPLANAGPDQNVTAGVTIQLDGNSSNDPDGSQLQFTWATLSRPTGSVATISDAAVVNPTFVADLPGVYLVELLVSDGVLTSPADTMTVTATAPIVTVTAADPSASEDGSDPGAFRISRTGDTSFPLAVSISIEGTASSGTDYASLPTTVTIPTGATETDLTVNPVDDTEIEDNETVVLTVLDKPHYDVGSDSAATVNITDNDRPTVTVSSTDIFAAEQDHDPANFIFSRTGPTTSPLIVDFTITGSATNGVDYTFLPSTVTIPAGESSTMIQVLPTDDSEFELTESVVITLQGTPNYNVGSPSEASIGITDNDTSVSIVASDPEANEEGLATGSFEVSRVGPTTEAMTVFYTVDGTADNGIDYDQLSGSVVIPAGSRTTSIIVTPIDDNTIEGPETVRLTLTPNFAYTIGVLDAATVNIVDNEKPNVTIVTTENGSEIGPTAGRFTVRRNGPTTTPLTVFYTIAGNALNSIDYQTIGGSVIIPAGSETADVVITPIEDQELEGTEFVILVLDPADDYAPVQPSLAQMAIQDEDIAHLTINATAPPASESGPSAGAFTITRTGDTSRPLVITCTHTGTASGNDYVSIGGFAFIVTIPTGASSVVIPITPLPDNLVEGDETVIVTISPSGSYNIDGSGTATVTITDDPPQVNLTETDTEASEVGPDPGVLTFTRSGGNIAAALPVFISRTGTATGSLDFVNFTSIVTIPANQLSTPLTISPLQDNLVEGNETVTITILPGSVFANYLIGSPSVGTVNIADDPPIMSVTALDPSASEVGPDPGVFNFTRSGGDVSKSLLIQVRISGTATNGTDYQSPGGAFFFVTIPPNETTATITINPFPDSFVEGDETVVFTIQPSASYSIGNPSTATVTIADAP